MEDLRINPFAASTASRKLPRGKLPPLDHTAVIPSEADDALRSFQVWLIIAALAFGGVGMLLLMLAAFRLVTRDFSLSSLEVTTCLALVVTGSILVISAFLGLASRGQIARYLARRNTARLERVVMSQGSLIKFLAMAIGTLAGFRLLGLAFTLLYWILPTL